MKVVFWACFCATVAAAPTILEDLGPQETGLASQMDYLRGRRSHIHQYAMTPCAAAASAHQHGYSPAGYQQGHYPQSYSYHSPSYSQYQHLYRNNPFDEDQEMMSFSDADFIDPAPRYAYPYEVAQASNTQVSHVPSTAYGLFPNANIGNCGVPLLFSCSPSIVKGRVVKSQPVYSVHDGSSHSDGYREVDMHQQEALASNHNEVVSEHLTTSDGNQGAGKL